MQNLARFFAVLIISVSVGALMGFLLCLSTGTKFDLKTGDILVYSDEGNTNNPYKLPTPQAGLYVVTEIKDQSVELSGVSVFLNENFSDKTNINYQVNRNSWWDSRADVDSWAFKKVGRVSN